MTDPRRSKAALRRAVRKMGLDVTRYAKGQDPKERWMKLIDGRRIDLVFDVGANTGQYGRDLRARGYKGRIVSFEPLVGAYAALRRESDRDSRWEVENVALGDRPGDVELNVAANSQSSSLLEMLPEHRLASPESRYVRRERATMTTLASVIGRHARPEDRILVKIDVQGYERQVISGCGSALDDVLGFEVELSLVPLYDGQPVLDEMVSWMRGLGFTLMSIEQVFWNAATGQLLQVDGLFFRV